MKAFAGLRTFLMLFLLFHCSFSAMGEKSSYIFVSYTLDEAQGNISLNLTVLYFNFTTIRKPSVDNFADIIENKNIVAVENATVYASYRDTTYNERGEPTQNLVPLPCSPLTTNESYEIDDKVVFYGICTVDGELYSNAFNNTCREMLFYFPGQVLEKESIPPSERTLTICTGKPSIFEAFKNILATAIDPTNPFCMSMFILFGLLLATLFFTGRPPLSLLDLLTPILPRPKKISYRAGAHGTGHAGMKKGAKKILGGIEKQAKKEMKVAAVDAASKNKALYDLVMKSDADSVRKLLALRAISNGESIDTINKILNTPTAKLFDVIQKLTWLREGDPLYNYLALYVYTNATLHAYKKLTKFPGPKWVEKGLDKITSIPGLGYLLAEVKPSIEYGLLFARLTKMAVVGVPLRKALKKAGAYEDIKKAAEKGKGLEKLAAKAIIGITGKEEPAVGWLLNVKKMAEDMRKRAVIEALTEVIEFILLKPVEKSLTKKQLEELNALKDDIIKAMNNKNYNEISKLAAKLIEFTRDIEKMQGTYYGGILQKMLSIYNDPNLSMYEKAYRIRDLAAQRGVLTLGELSAIDGYLRLLTKIESDSSINEMQKLVRMRLEIDAFRDGLKKAKSSFIPYIFTPDAEMDGILNKAFSILFVREILAQPQATLSQIANLFSLKYLQMFVPLMPYDLLPVSMQRQLKNNGMDKMYKDVMIIADKLLDNLIRTSGLNKADLMKGLTFIDLAPDGINLVKKPTSNPFEILRCKAGEFKNINLDHRWFVSPVGAMNNINRSALLKTELYTTKGEFEPRYGEWFASAVNLSFMGAIDAKTNSLVRRDGIMLFETAYQAMRHYAAKLGYTTDSQFDNFMSKDENLKVKIDTLKSHSWVRTRYGYVPYIDSVFRPTDYDSYFYDKKILSSSPYLFRRFSADEIFKYFIPKYGAGAWPESYVNMYFVINKNGKWEFWKPAYYGKSELLSLDQKLGKALSNFEKNNPHLFMRLDPTTGQLVPLVEGRTTFSKLYSMAMSGNRESFEALKSFLISQQRGDIFMNIAATYEKISPGVSNVYAGTEGILKIMPLREAKNEVQTVKAKADIFWREKVAGTVAGILGEAALPIWGPMVDIVAFSETARRYADRLSGMEFEGAVKLEKSLTEALKTYRYAWEWTITRDVILYGGYERYSRPGYLTGGFQIGPAMPLTHWVGERALSALMPDVPILGSLMRKVALYEMKLGCGFMRGFTLATRGFSYSRVPYPSPFDLKPWFPGKAEFSPDHVFYNPMRSRVIGMPRYLANILTIPSAAVLAPWGFFREFHERKDLAGWARIRESLKNSFLSAQGALLWAKDQGIASRETYEMAPRTIDMYRYYSYRVGEIGASDTNPGLSYVQSYSGEYVHEPITPQVLTAAGYSPPVKVKESMFDVHERRTISAIGMAAYQYEEISWADPSRFWANPMYAFLSPGMMAISLGRWAFYSGLPARFARRTIARMTGKKEYLPESFYEKWKYEAAKRASGPVTSWETLKYGGAKSLSAIRDWISDKVRLIPRYATPQRKFVRCPMCGSWHIRGRTCPKCHI